MTEHQLVSTIVPSELQSEFDTVSEALLQLNEDTIEKLSLNAPLVCHPNRTIVPVEFQVTMSNINPLLAIREHLLHSILSLPEEDRAATITKLFPPAGEVGFWDPEERIYRTRYMQDAAFSLPFLTQEQAKQWKVHDIPSYWRAIHQGRITPFMKVCFDSTPPTLNQPWGFQSTEEGNPFPPILSVGYRGCNRIYEYPFRPSFFRRFTSAEGTNSFDNLRKFVSNLLVELLWCQKEITINPFESESIIQHYKLLPWSYMTDISYDINIAKAFACSEATLDNSGTPVLYKVILFNINYYEFGASMIDKLPFERPKRQRAISMIGLNPIMQDPTGVIVSLTEHPFYHTEKGTSWDQFGGANFNLDGCQFNSLSLKKEEYQELETMLFPHESEAVIALFRTIYAKVRNRIESFGLLDSDLQSVIDRLDKLEKELMM